MTKKTLKDRWTTPVTSAELTESPFGKTEEGLEDFRGAQLTWPLFKFEIEGFDLSYTSLWSFNSDIGQMSVCTISNTKFVEVKYVGTLAPDAMQDCLFEKGIMDLNITAGHWHRCVFKGVNFKKSTATVRVTFEDCEFVDCLMTRVEFMEVSFINCTFKNCKTGPWASFGRSKFIGCDLSAMDFDEAILSNIVVEGCVLPAGGLPSPEMQQKSVFAKIDRMIEKHKQ